MSYELLILSSEFFGDAVRFTGFSLCSKMLRFCKLF